MEQELDLYAIWQVIKKKWKLIVLIPLMAAGVSAAISLFLIVPQYNASTTLIVNRPADSTELIYRDLQLSRELVGTYREIIHSRRVLEQVIANRSLPFNITDMREKVTVEALRNTELIQVDVTDPDPALATEIANEVARSFMSQVIEIMQIENVSVVDEAVMPNSPISPRVPLNVAVAFVVGLMGAFGLVFLLEYVDRTIKDPTEAEKQLGMPVVGVVPQVNGDMLFTLNDPRSPPAEAFRTLRTNIQYSSVDLQIRQILVSGANPSCGKSTIAANLAVTLARSGASVLLVDADMRKPTIHKIFEINNEPGLSSLIFNEELDMASVVRKSDHKKLMLMPSGPIPPYPAEMLASARMKKLSGYFAQQFDYVIFDSPPIIAVTDAAVVSRLVDGTLFVLDYGRVKTDEALGALEHLHKVQANILGAVINGVPHNKDYYYSYQYYYGSEDSEGLGSRKSKKRKQKAAENF